ncbi:MAG: hypothetical protein AAFR26_19340 [Cyanobacteria bacterium J06626_4]
MSHPPAGAFSSEKVDVGTFRRWILEMFLGAFVHPPSGSVLSSGTQPSKTDDDCLAAKVPAAGVQPCDQDIKLLDLQHTLWRNDLVAISYAECALADTLPPMRRSLD